ncbi:MAG: DNA translocase FtsK 4TM domain-containing protein [Holosporales bacterium]|nr:DNA translocase FtsK 4TM domain-containing protein [Holosporales bacterium]
MLLELAVKNQRLASQDLRAIFSRCIGVLLGTLFFLLAAVLALALVSYNPSDISFNVSNNLDPTNWLSIYGSYTADFLMQIFGLASYVLPLTLSFWGWQALCNTSVPWHRGMLVIIACTAASCLFASTTRLDIGNFCGKAIVEFINSLLGSHAYLKACGSVLMPLIWVLLAFVMFCYSTKTAFRSVILAVEKLYGWVSAVISSVFAGCKKFFGFMLGSQNLNWSDSGLGMINGDGLVSPQLTLDHGDKHIAASKNDSEINMSAGEFVLPPLDFLHQPKVTFDKEKLDQRTLESNAKRLKSVLEEFGIRGEIIGVKPGPVITLYELQPAAGIKSARVIGLAGDIAMSMSAISARVAVVPGRNVIGIELPNVKRQTVFLRELLSDSTYTSSPSPLTVALGKDIGGDAVIVDLARMPHLLVAGTTGSGKSVGVNAMILSLLYKLSPEQCKFIMIDPKMLELSVYDGIPHLLSPVVTDSKKAVVALKWAVNEMESRYRTMSKLGVRNVEGYNGKVLNAKKTGDDLSYKVQTGYDPETSQPIYEYEDIPLTPFPYIVIIVDEMADLMLTAGKEIDATVQRLAQMARAAGIHLIMATQRPSVDVITGTIKANFPSRISFQVASRIDSRTILGEQGSEQLLGQGDMLYMSTGGRITRIHGPFVSDQEVEKVVQYLKQFGPPDYMEEITRDPEEDIDDDVEFGGFSFAQADPLYDQALEIVLREGRATTSFIQRCLQIGYNRSARMIERMEKEGVVSKPNHIGKREVLK